MCADLYLLDRRGTGLFLNYSSTSCRFRGIALLLFSFQPVVSCLVQAAYHASNGNIQRSCGFAIRPFVETDE